MRHGYSGVIEQWRNLGEFGSGMGKEAKDQIYLLKYPDKTEAVPQVAHISYKEWTY